LSSAPTLVMSLRAQRGGGDGLADRLRLAPDQPHDVGQRAVDPIPAFRRLFAPLKHVGEIDEHLLDPLHAGIERRRRRGRLESLERLGDLSELPLRGAAQLALALYACLGQFLALETEGADRLVPGGGHLLAERDPGAVLPDIRLRPLYVARDRDQIGDHARCRQSGRRLGAVVGGAQMRERGAQGAPDIDLQKRHRREGAKREAANGGQRHDQRRLAQRRRRHHDYEAERRRQRHRQGEALGATERAFQRLVGAARASHHSKRPSGPRSKLISSSARPNFAATSTTAERAFISLSPTRPCAEATMASATAMSSTPA
jgi:hypothetical protein